MKKLIYQIFWQEILIGKIFIANENKYLYYPNYDNMELASKSGLPRFLYLMPQLEAGELPQVFKERIQNDKDCANECKLATDKIRIVKIAT